MPHNSTRAFVNAMKNVGVSARVASEKLAIAFGDAGNLPKDAFYFIYEGLDGGYVSHRSDIKDTKKLTGGWYEQINGELFYRISVFGVVRSVITARKIMYSLNLSNLCLKPKYDVITGKNRTFIVLRGDKIEVEISLAARITQDNFIGLK